MPVLLEMNREIRYNHIEMRGKAMFEAGLYDEVRVLAARGWTPRDPALKAIGYREFFAKTEEGGYVLRTDLEAVYAEIVKNSRHYAKRQETWFKKVPGMRYLPADGGAALIETIRALISALVMESAAPWGSTNGQ
jgi:tRNA dimethylallyltransferase